MVKYRIVSNGARAEPSTIDKILKNSENERSTKTYYSTESLAFHMGRLANLATRVYKKLQKFHLRDTGESLDFEGIRGQYNSLEILCNIHERLTEEFVSIKGYSIEKAVEFNQNVQRVESTQTMMGTTDIEPSTEPNKGRLSWFK